MQYNMKLCNSMQKIRFACSYAETKRSFATLAIQQKHRNTRHRRERDEVETTLEN